MKRALIILLLAVVCPFTMGAGFRSGSRWGVGISPGFATMQRDADIGLRYSDAPIDGQYRQYLQDDWTFSSAPKLSAWNDSSANDQDGIQNTSTLQPVVLANGAVCSPHDSGAQFVVSNMGLATGTYITRVVKPTLAGTFTDQSYACTFGYEPYFRADQINATTYSYSIQAKSGWRFTLTGSIPMADATDEVVAVRITGGADWHKMELWLDGVYQADETQATAAGAGCTVLLNIADGFFAQGWTEGCRAIWVYDRILTDAEMAETVNWKWWK